MLDFTIVEKVIGQLMNSDGMEVTNPYLIQQKIHYIDNVSLIEELETLVVRHYYEEIKGECGSVSYDELFSIYTPRYINYDKLFLQLEKEYADCFVEEGDGSGEVTVTLNKYF